MEASVGESLPLKWEGSEALKNSDSASLHALYGTFPKYLLCLTVKKSFWKERKRKIWKEREVGANSAYPVFLTMSSNLLFASLVFVMSHAFFSTLTFITGSGLEARSGTSF